MHRSNPWLPVFAALVISAGTSLFATHDVASTNGVNELLKEQPDAVSYAEANGVSVEEAAYRLSIQVQAGLLDAELADAYQESYAGLWLQHRPRFRIIVQFTDTSPLATGEARVAPDLASLIDVREVEYSLQELDDQLDAISSAASDARVALSLDVMGNRVLVQRTDQSAALFLTPSALSKGVVMDSETYISRPAAIALIAGFPISGGCTNGFTAVVKNVPDAFRMTTAGHCPDPEVYSGQNMPFVLEKFQGSHDEQSHGIAQTIPTNKFMTGSPPYARTVTSRTFRANQPINGWTCKFGNTTQYTCGYLWTKNHQPSYVPSANPTFMLVKPEGGPDMVNPGDSGGPVYLGHSAYGLVSGEIGLPWCICDLIYTASDYVEAGLNVWILTYAP